MESTSPASILSGFQTALKKLNTKKRDMSTSTHDLIRQLEKAYELLDQRTRDLELAAHVGQTLLQSNNTLTTRLDQLTADHQKQLDDRQEQCEDKMRQEMEMATMELEEQLNEQEELATAAEQEKDRSAERYQAEISELEMELSSRQQAVDETEDKLNSMKTQATRHKCLSEKQEVDLSDLQSEVEHLTDELSNCHFQLANLESDKIEGQCEARREATQANLEAAENTELLSEKLSSAQLALQDLTIQLAEAKKNNSELDTAYNTKVAAMQERMETFEETVETLEAERHETSMDGSLQQEMAFDSQELYAMVDKVTADAEASERSWAYKCDQLRATVTKLEEQGRGESENIQENIQSTKKPKANADEPKSPLSRSTLFKQVNKLPTEDSPSKAAVNSQIDKCNALRAAGYTPRRIATPAGTEKRLLAADGSSPLGGAISRMQGTLSNLRQCAAQMKNRAASCNVRDRVQLSEKAMNAYRDLKAIKPVPTSK